MARSAVDDPTGRRRAVRRAYSVVMLVEATTFVVAAALHLDARLSLGFATVSGERAPDAAIAELIVAAVLVGGAGVVALRPDEARQAAAVATGFAIFGVIVGLVTIATGIGRRTIPDLGYDMGIMLVLLISFAVLLNRRRERVGGRGR